jgi:hypothetical protein
MVGGRGAASKWSLRPWPGQRVDSDVLHDNLLLTSAVDQCVTHGNEQLPCRLP